MKGKCLISIMTAASLLAVSVPVIRPLGYSAYAVEVDDVNGQNNIIANGDFFDFDESSNTFASWEANSANAEWKPKAGTAIFNINTVGADWGPNLSQNVAMETGREYKVSYDIKVSGSDRQIMTGFDNGRVHMHTETIKAGEKKTVTYAFTNDSLSGENNKFMFYLGKQEAEADFAVPCTVEISNVSIEKIRNSKDDFLEQTAEPAPVVEGNLLKNGGFSEENGAGWTTDMQNAKAYFNKNVTVVDIAQNMADWQQRLYQNVILEAGSNYTISFEVKSTVERTVMAGFDPTRLEPVNVPADGQWHTVEYKYTENTGGEKPFTLYLGTDKGVHQIAVKNVVLVKNRKELPDTENDMAPEALKSLAGTTAQDSYILKNGDFKNGLEDWKTYCVDWMNQYDVTQFTVTEDGLKVHSKNLGDAEGNKAYDVKLYQPINLKAGKAYTLSFDVTTEKDRSIIAVLEDLPETFEKKIAVREGEVRHVVLNIPVQEKDALNKLFSIQMGKVEGDVLDNNLVISNMKIEENGYRNLAELIKDGNFDEETDVQSVTMTHGTASIENKSLRIQTNGGEEAVLKKTLNGMEAGQKYILSFMAGARSKEEVKAVVTLPDGREETISLDRKPKLYSFEFEAGKTEGTFEVNFGTQACTVFMDTLRADAKGFAEAAGIKADKHDIVALEDKEAPVISEDAEALEKRLLFLHITVTRLIQKLFITSSLTAKLLIKHFGKLRMVRLHWMALYLILAAHRIKFLILQCVLTGMKIIMLIRLFMQQRFGIILLPMSFQAAVWTQQSGHIKMVQVPNTALPVGEIMSSSIIRRKIFR